MKTKQIDLEIERLTMLKNRSELTDTGIELLDELINLKKQLRIGGVSNFVRQELERRVDLILSEPDGIVRETMIKNIPLDL